MITLYIPLLGLAVIFTAILLASYWSGQWSAPNHDSISKELEDIAARIDHIHDVKVLEKLLVRVNVIMVLCKHNSTPLCQRLSKKIDNCHDRIAARIRRSRK
jgi:hypothetical protein